MVVGSVFDLPKVMIVRSLIVVFWGIVGSISMMSVSMGGKVFSSCVCYFRGVSDVFTVVGEFDVGEGSVPFGCVGVMGGCFWCPGGWGGGPSVWGRCGGPAMMSGDSSCLGVGGVVLRLGVGHISGVDDSAIMGKGRRAVFVDAPVGWGVPVC